MTGKHVEQVKASMRKTFDEWLRVTGAVHPASSWRYEIESMLEDAVEAGAAAEGRARHADQG